MGHSQVQFTADPASATTQETDVTPALAILGSTVEVVSMTAEQTNAADAEWNVSVDGNDLFSSEQQVTAGGTPETFTPDQNEFVADDTVPFTVDVSSAGSAGDLIFNVVLDDGE